MTDGGRSDCSNILSGNLEEQEHRGSSEAATEGSGPASAASARAIHGYVNYRRFPGPGWD
jgi:hypothetical protein